MVKYFLSLCCLLLLTTIDGQTELRVEPPFWWSGMVNTQLQLMVHGADIGNCVALSSNKSISITKTHKADSPNYLFIDLDLSNASSAQFTIELKENNQTKASFNYELKSRQANSKNRKGITPADVLYLITPDRFANGNSTNDEVIGMKEKLNRAAEYGRHGGDIQGIRDHLDYLDDLGFTAIWLNPVLENDQEKWSYHGYSTTDYYKVDPRFGSNEEYIALSQEAKSKGIGMVMDIIVNHCGSSHWWMTDPPFDNWINNQSGPYLQTNHKKETLLDPYKAASDRTMMTEGWFVPTMPDLNQRNTFMSTYLIQNSIWWIEYADLAAIRQDTYSYPFKSFMTDWTCAIMTEYPDFYIVGEEWIDDPAVISYWQAGKNNADGNDSCLPGLMDFPLCFSIHKGMTEEEGWNTGLIRMYQSLTKDYQYPDPSQLVIFPDNHDMKRIFVEMNEDMALYKMALAFIMTTRGIPQLYYGTEIAMNAGKDGSHGLLRADFPGGWEGDTTSVLKRQNLNTQELEALNYCKKLLNWRKQSTVIHEGQLMHYVPEAGVYTYFRYDGNNSVMVILNKNDKAVSLDLTRFEERLSRYNKGKNIMTEETITLKDTMQLEASSALILELGS